MRLSFRAFLFIFTLILFASCSNNKNNYKSINVSSYSSLDSILVAENYISDKGISELYIQNFDESIRNLERDKKKALFIKSMLSNILLVNRDIQIQREELDYLELRYIDYQLNASESKKVEKLFSSYRCSEGDFDCLRTKINIFPPSLIIAQSIVESGWGSSRFAIEANSIFGEHFSNGAEGEFIEASGSDIRLRSFNSIEESIKSYCLNLNRHRAYRELRKMRNEMLAKGDLDSFVLCEGLKSYSERGDEYVADLQGIIKSNKLQQYDKLSLLESKKITKIYIK